jgi:hypothetical protein
VKRFSRFQVDSPWRIKTNVCIREFYNRRFCPFPAT